MRNTVTGLRLPIISRTCWKFRSFLAKFHTDCTFVEAAGSGTYQESYVDKTVVQIKLRPKISFYPLFSWPLTITWFYLSPCVQDFFPPNKQTQEMFEKHFNANGLDKLVLFQVTWLVYWLIDWLICFCHITSFKNILKKYRLKNMVRSELEVWGFYVVQAN